jgi:hypothetical protein
LCGIFARFSEDLRVGRIYLRCLCDVVITFPAEEALIAILAEGHEALLGLSDSEEGAMSTTVMQMLDVLAIIEN